MKNLFAMAVPILPGKTEQFNKFIKELKSTRYHDFVESRKKLGVRERSFLQKTPMGDFVVVTLEGENPQAAFTNFGQGKDEFTKWFASQVKEIHGVDLSSTQAVPLPEMFIDSLEEVYHF
jgi:hypothetical protein